MGWWEKILEEHKPASMPARYWVAVSALVLLEVSIVGAALSSWISENPAWVVPLVSAIAGIVGIVFGLGCSSAARIEAARWEKERAVLEERIHGLEEGRASDRKVIDRASEVLSNYAALANESSNLIDRLQTALAGALALQSARPIDYGPSGLDQ